MICKDISFIEKVLSEQELLKSKCENKFANCNNKLNIER